MKWTNNDMDKAYILGVLNSGGMDALEKELKRLEGLGVKPYQIIERINNKNKNSKP